MTPQDRLTGLDGRSYPRGPITSPDVVALVHRLAHEGQRVIPGRSIRQVVAALADMGVQRSIGRVQADLTTWSCEHCASNERDVQVGTSGTPEHDVHSTPTVLVTAEGITVRQEQPMSPEEAREVALRLLEASTAHLATGQALRRPAAVDEALRERD